MIKVFSLLAAILFFILLPPAILAFASQDALPGDRLYPFKRGLESGILTIASLHPTSKAWFSLDYTDRRFTEAKRLINRGVALEIKNSLNDLVMQTSQVATEIQTIENQEQKRQLIAELSKSINEYKEGLTQVKQGVQTANVNPTSPPSSTPPQPQPSLTTFSPTPSATPLAYNPPTPSSPLSSIDQYIEETIDELDEIEETLEEEEDNLDFLEDQELEEDDEDDERGNRGRGNGDDRGRDDEHEGRGRGGDD